MKIDTLRAVRESKPIRPFQIDTGLGESYMITHPEIIARLPHGNGAAVFPKANEVNWIDDESITEITTFSSSQTVGLYNEPDFTS